MTKQEYEAKEQLLRDTYICDSDYFGRLVDLDTEYIESLEAEVANLNEWLTTWKESLNLAQAEIAKLKANAITWHRYPDEKPDMDVKCLVMFDDGEPIISSFDGFNWWDIEKAWVGRITHWAYLPAPPKDGE